ncbi:MAG: hypothetical protein J0I32_11005 [Sphingobacteriales bacterium]|nr:hypothetical protein [Sphingobacteriales bacterium]
MMKTSIVSALMMLFVLVACDKKEPEPLSGSGGGMPVENPTDCGKEIIASTPVKVGETGIMLPVGTKICITKDEMEVRVELPAGYAFLTDQENGKTLPVIFSTYTCICSKAGSPCQVFYAEGLGFGCLQSSCSGSCTGKFTYMGYTVEKLMSTTDKAEFFGDPLVQRRIRKTCGIVETPTRRNANPEDMVYVKQEMMGLNYYLLLDKTSIPASMRSNELISSRALCECEGTKVCKLRTVSLRATQADERVIDIYFCDGGCNGCELTVD